MRIEFTSDDGLDVELTKLPDGSIELYATAVEYENATGRLTIEEAKELRTALDLVIGAA